MKVLPTPALILQIYILISPEGKIGAANCSKQKAEILYLTLLSTFLKKLCILNHESEMIERWPLHLCSP